MSLTRRPVPLSDRRHRSPRRRPLPIERVVDDELTRLQNDLVPADELQRAIRQLESQFVYSSEGADESGLLARAVGNRRQLASRDIAADEIRSVTADDVRRVAQRYLLPERRTVGWLEPLRQRGGSCGLAGCGRSALCAADGVGAHGSACIARAQATGRFDRAVLPNGIPVLGQERPQSRSFALRMRVPAGVVYEVIPRSPVSPS